MVRPWLIDFHPIDFEAIGPQSIDLGMVRRILTGHLLSDLRSVRFALFVAGLSIP